MLKTVPIALAVGLGRQTLRYLWRPRTEPYKNAKKRNNQETPPYERLVVSAVFSRLAYKPFLEFRKESIECVKDDPSLLSLVKNCFASDANEITFIDASAFHDFQDTQVYIWIKDRILYVVFRGSESKQDFLANIDLRRKCAGFGPNILVHNGFRGQFEAVEERLTAYILTHKGEYDEIYFLGHSLGMACATISALFYNQYFKENLDENDIPILHCHSFGGPRVGNRDFVKFYQEQERLFKNTWRVVNYDDPVPRVPISFRFCHIPSHTLFIGEDGKIYQTKKDTHWLLRPLELFVSACFFKHVKTHFMEFYIERLRDIVIEIRRSHELEKPGEIKLKASSLDIILNHKSNNPDFETSDELVKIASPLLNCQDENNKKHDG